MRAWSCGGLHEEVEDEGAEAVGALEVGGVAGAGDDDQPGAGDPGRRPPRAREPGGIVERRRSTSVGAATAARRSWSGSIAPWPAETSRRRGPSGSLAGGWPPGAPRAAGGERRPRRRRPARASQRADERVDPLALQRGGPARRPRRGARRGRPDRRSPPRALEDQAAHRRPDGRRPGAARSRAHRVADDVDATAPSRRRIAARSSAVRSTTRAGGVRDPSAIRLAPMAGRPIGQPVPPWPGRSGTIARNRPPSPASPRPREAAAREAVEEQDGPAVARDADGPAHPATASGGARSSSRLGRAARRGRPATAAAASRWSATFRAGRFAAPGRGPRAADRRRERGAQAGGSTTSVLRPEGGDDRPELDPVGRPEQLLVVVGEARRRARRPSPAAGTRRCRRRRCR